MGDFLLCLDDVAKWLEPGKDFRNTAAIVAKDNSSIFGTVLIPCMDGRARLRQLLLAKGQRADL